jgi:N-acetylglucosaminyldiphosphoundecaprenol N-acetyl-beta-D-mannosaminyltransferase
MSVDFKRLSVLTTRYTIGSFEQILDATVERCLNRTPAYICVSAVHLCVEAVFNPNIRLAVENATLVTTDGMPLTYALKLLYGQKQDRVAGMDFLPRILKKLNDNKLSVFF